jgi:hypothetical protein
MIKRLVFVGFLACGLTLSVQAASSSDQVFQNFENTLEQVKEHNVEAYETIKHQWAEIKQLVIEMKNQKPEEASFKGHMHQLAENCWKFAKYLSGGCAYLSVAIIWSKLINFLVRQMGLPFPLAWVGLFSGAIGVVANL